MAIANAVQATALSDRPIKCPLCQSIIKHARNLRRHVFKRHLPAAQRGEITEADVKNILERKLKTITVTPLTDDELRQVQQRIRRKGIKTPRKLKGIAALPLDVNSSHINESEITIRKLPQKKKEKPATLTLVTNVLAPVDVSRQHDPSPHEDILQEALAARDKDPQEEVMDLATSQLPPISVVVSHTDVQEAQPVSLTVSQTGVRIHTDTVLPVQTGLRLQTETGLRLQNETGLRLQTETGLRLQTEAGLRLQAEAGLHRELATMPAMAFEPQVSISEASYHTSIPQSSSPSSPSNYIPATYWSAPGMTALPSSTFQPHQSVFTPAHAEYFTTSMHMVRPSSLDRMPQHRRKPYQ